MTIWRIVSSVPSVLNSWRCPPSWWQNRQVNVFIDWRFCRFDSDVPLLYYRPYLSSLLFWLASFCWTSHSNALYHATRFLVSSPTDMSSLKIGITSNAHIAQKALTLFRKALSRLDLHVYQVGTSEAQQSYLDKSSTNSNPCWSSTWKDRKLLIFF